MVSVRQWLDLSVDQSMLVCFSAFAIWALTGTTTKIDGPIKLGIGRPSVHVEYKIVQLSWVSRSRGGIHRRVEAGLAKGRHG